MMRQQRHPAGTFPTCPACNMEPRHILDQRRRPLGGHLLSCACGDGTKQDTLAQAADSWCATRNLRACLEPRARTNVLRRSRGPRQQVGP